MLGRGSSTYNPYSSTNDPASPKSKTGLRAHVLQKTTRTHDQCIKNADTNRLEKNNSTKKDIKESRDGIIEAE